MGAVRPCVDPRPRVGAPLREVPPRVYVLRVEERAGRPSVHVLVGLPAAGKTTVARRLASQHRAVRFGLDEWMIRLYALRFDDEEYVRRLPSCLDVVLDVAGQVLIAGVDVVLDWNHWSPDKRQASAVWAAERGARYLVHHVTTSLEDARAQLAVDGTQPEMSTLMSSTRHP